MKKVILVKKYVFLVASIKIAKNFEKKIITRACGVVGSALP